MKTLQEIIDEENAKNLADLGDVDPWAHLGDDYEQITTECIKVTEKTQNYNLEKDYNSKNKEISIIQYEFNLIELPFFAKDDNVKKGRVKTYKFNGRDNSYMSISPSTSPKHISNKILQEFDEKIFYAILELSHNQNSKEVITDYYTLMQKAKVSKKYKRVKDSIERLKANLIVLNNIFYSKEKSKILNTNIQFNMLQSVLTIDLKEFFKLPEDKKKVYEKYFRNSKIKEIIVIKLSDFIYENIEKNGYLTFKNEKLLRIKSGTARKIYVLLMKWQGWEKKQIIVRSCRFLASRIPLNWEAKNICMSLKNLEKACKHLLEIKLIKSFILKKEKPLENSSISFEMWTKHDHDLLEARDFEENKKRSVCTGHENLMIEKEINHNAGDIIDMPAVVVEKEKKQEQKQIQKKEEKKPEKQQEEKKEELKNQEEKIIIPEEDEDFQKLVKSLREDYRDKHSFLKLIAKYYNEKGYYYGFFNIQYANKKSKTDYYGFLKKAIENDYGKIDREDFEMQQEKIRKAEEEARLAEETEKNLKKCLSDIKKKFQEENYKKIFRKASFELENENKNIVIKVPGAKYSELLNKNHKKDLEEIFKKHFNNNALVLSIVFDAEVAEDTF